MRPTILVQAVVLLLAAAVARGASAHPSGIQDPPSTGPSPREILEQAAAVQGRPEGMKTGDERPLALHVEMVVELRDDKDNDVTLEVERRFLAPHLLWTRVQDSFSGAESVEGFDGKVGWFQGENSVTLLEGADFAEDRRKLQRSIDETRLYARLFFIENLLRELRDLQRLPDEKGYGITAYVLEGKGEFEEEGRKQEVVARLWIDQANHYLRGVRITRPSSKEPPLDLCFTLHERGKDGVLTPGRVEIFRVGEKDWQQRLSLARIDFAPKLRPEDFAPPKS